MRVTADRVVTTTPTPPGPSANWQPVTWPDTWRAPERYRQGVLGWYRFPLGAAPADRNAPWSIYLWRFSMNAQVWLNDRYLGSGGSFDEPVARNWNRPLLLDVPAGAWRPSDNTLYVRLRVYPGFGHLAPPLAGPRAELESAWAARHFMQITLAQAAFAIALMSSALGFALWLVLRDESSYALFALLCLAFAVYSLNQFIVDLPIPARHWWPITHSVVEWFSVTLVLFLHRLFAQRRAVLERVCIGFAVLATSLYFAFDLPQLARWNSTLHTLGFGMQIYCWWWLLGRVRRAKQHGERDIEAIGFLLFMTVLIGTSTTDLVLNSVLAPLLWRSLTYSSQLITPLLFIGIVVHLALRLSRTLAETRQANVALESRVAAARTEIERAYTEREALQREHAAAAERERIYRDLHDDLGSRLLSLVYGARDDRQAQLARDALAQMRTIVAAAKLEPSTLVECAAEWRLETELIGEAAGFRVEFAIEGDTPLSGDKRLQIERILRELTSNVVHHSGGTRFEVALGVTDAALLLRCDDDGAGMATNNGSDATPRDGVGMSSIRQRATELGGTANWRASPLGGVRVEVQVPLRS